MQVGAAIVWRGAPKLEHAPVNGVYATPGTLHHANALHGIGQGAVAGAWLGHQQIGQRHTVHQAARVADHQGLVLQPHMHCAHAVVVAVNQGIGHRLAKRSHVHQGHRHTEQTHLQLLLGVVGAKVGLQPIQRLEQWKAPKLIEAHRLLRQHLKSQLVRGHALLQHRLAANQQQTRQRGHPRAITLALREAQCAIHGLVVQLQQHTVTAVLLHRLAQALALQRVKVGKGAARHRLG